MCSKNSFRDPAQGSRAAGLYCVSATGKEPGLLESGKAKNLSEVAELVGMDRAYVSRMVNLTTLAPDIVAAILADNLPDHITLFELAVDPPALWDSQRERLTRPATAK